MRLSLVEGVSFGKLENRWVNRGKIITFRHKYDKNLADIQREVETIASTISALVSKRPVNNLILSVVADTSFTVSVKHGCLDDAEIEALKKIVLVLADLHRWKVEAEKA